MFKSLLIQIIKSLAQLHLKKYAPDTYVTLISKSSPQTDSVEHILRQKYQVKSISRCKSEPDLYLKILDCHPANIHSPAHALVSSLIHLIFSWHSHDKLHVVTPLKLAPTLAFLNPRNLILNFTSKLPSSVQSYVTNLTPNHLIICPKSHLKQLRLLHTSAQIMIFDPSQLNSLSLALSQDEGTMPPSSDVLLQR